MSYAGIVESIPKLTHRVQDAAERIGVHSPTSRLLASVMSSAASNSGPSMSFAETRPPSNGAPTARGGVRSLQKSGHA